MKRLLSIATLMLILQANIAQNILKYNKTKYFWGDSIYTLNTIQSFTKFDSVLYIACDIVDSLHDQRLTLIKTDLEGNIIEKIKLGSTEYLLGTYPGNSIIIDNDTNILVCDLIIFDSTSQRDGYIIKINQDLDTIWSMVDKLPDSLAGCLPGDDPVNFLTAIKESPEGGYIAVGNYYKNCIPNNYGSYLIKLDTTGNVIWRKVYQDIEQVYNIEITQDSGFVFTDFYTGFAINKTDSLGNVKWKKDPNNLWHLTSSDICISGNEIIAACPYMYNSDVNNPKFGIDVVKLTENGQIVWNKQYYQYLSFECITLHQSFEIEALPNGDIVICGTAYVANNDSSAFGYMGTMLKLNGNGDSLWSHYYNYGHFADDCQFNDFVLTDDGGFLAAGFHFPYDGSYNSGAWLVKMDSLGNAPGCFTQDISKYINKISSLSIYPNPTKGIISLILDKKYETIEIFNSQGQLIYQEDIKMTYNQTMTEIDISKFPNASYTILITGENGTKVGKVVKY